MARRPGGNTARIRAAVQATTDTFDVEEERTRKRMGTEMSFPVEFPGSSRIFAYRYVPGEDNYYGNLYVRFVKYGTPWVYYNIPIGVYQAFTTSPSKGKFVNTTLNSFPYGHASPVDEDTFFDGF